MSKVKRCIKNICLVWGMMTLMWGIVCIANGATPWNVGLAGFGALMSLFGAVGRDDWNA